MLGVTDLLLAAGIVCCLVWLGVLTGRCRRHLRDCVDGEPVYRRMPDGRYRFSWMVNGELARAGGAAGQGHPEEIR